MKFLLRNKYLDYGKIVPSNKKSGSKVPGKL